MCGIFEYWKSVNNGVFPSTTGEYLYCIMMMLVGFTALYCFYYPMLYILLAIFSGKPRRKICKFTAIVDFWIVIFCFVSSFFTTPSGRLIWFK